MCPATQPSSWCTRAQHLAQTHVRNLACTIVADEHIWGFHVQVADLVRVQHKELLADVRERLLAPEAHQG